jgi:Rod binding domain-containing protein
MLNSFFVDMNITALRPAPKADSLPLEKLEESKAFTDEEKVAEVSRQFEAVLLRQILGQGRKTLFASKFNDDSVSSDIYQDMVTQQFAESISRSGSFGLARSLQAQLTHQLLPAKSAAVHAPTAHVTTKPPAHD